MNIYYTVALVFGVTVDSFILGKHIKDKLIFSLLIVSFTHLIFFYAGLHVGVFFYEIIGPFIHWFAVAIFIYLAGDAARNFFKEEKFTLTDDLKKIILITIPLSIDAFAVSASSRSLITNPTLALILVAIFAPLFCYLGYESVHRLAKISHRTFYFLETIFFLVLAINIYYNHILI